MKIKSKQKENRVSYTLKLNHNELALISCILGNIEGEQRNYCLDSEGLNSRDNKESLYDMWDEMDDELRKLDN